MEKTYTYALDISLSNTGIAIFTNNGNFVECDSIDTTKEKSLSGKLVMIAERYRGFIKKYKPSKIIMEQSFTRYNISTQMIYRCVGLTNYIFSDYEQVDIPSTTVKKVVGGKGNMTKEEVKQAILKKYPKIEFKNYDESDAFGVGLTYFIKEGIKNAS